jgi:hypothetical protein
MKDTSFNKREVIRGERLNRETLYYTVLFGIAFVVITVLMVFGFMYHNPVLAIYAGILVPIFIAGFFVTLRLTLVSKNTVYVENKTLVIKSFASTKKYQLKEITRITAATNSTTGVTTINVTSGATTKSYSFKNFTNDQIAQLRKATSNI